MKRKINNGIFYVVISLVAILAVVGVAVAYTVSQNINVSDGGTYNYYEAEGQTSGDISLGATAGPDFYQPLNFHAGLTTGIWATSTSGTTETLTEGDLLKYGIWEITPNTGSLTYTLPATSTLSSLMKNKGDSQTFVFQNATTSTGINFTLAAGTGWNLSGDDANVDVIAGAAYTARVSQYVKCWRQTNTDIHCDIEEAIAVD